MLLLCFATPRGGNLSYVYPVITSGGSDDRLAEYHPASACLCVATLLVQMPGGGLRGGGRGRRQCIERRRRRRRRCRRQWSGVCVGRSCAAVCSRAAVVWQAEADSGPTAGGPGWSSWWCRPSAVSRRPAPPPSPLTLNLNSLGVQHAHHPLVLSS